ncbi:hypothetical protein [Bergeyella zoohelcum]|uniref:hypothetical protein n=1 Tax=Bergeyella zoohelcum TaxID=1015 RepID=UPI0037354862
MNKTTVKISVLAFLGFMTYGYAQQQQQDPHRGKVGINTVTPSATMDIRPSTANAQKEATTNEGIIAPKLSKTRIANIATPVEGTLVYATDETTSPISAYTGGDTKVAKITEKGYYFYNGTEWVKAGSDVTDKIWKADVEKIFLDQNMLDTVEYLKTGGYRFLPKPLRSITVHNGQNFVDESLDLDGKAIYNWKVTFSDAIKQKGNTLSGGYKAMIENQLVIDEKDTSGLNTFGVFNKVQTNQNFNRTIGAMYATLGSSTHNGTGKVGAIMGGNFNAVIAAGTADAVVGAHNQATINTTGAVSRVVGTTSLISARSTGDITSMIGTQNRLQITGSNFNSKILTLAMTQNSVDLGDRNAMNVTGGSIENIIGTHTQIREVDRNTKISVKNVYGILVEDIKGGTEKNHSIYTGIGKIRFGDLSSANSANNAATDKDKLVFVTTDGVLKVGDFSVVITPQEKSKWINDTVSSAVKLSKLSNGTTDRAEQNNIYFKDSGRVGIGTNNPSQKLHVKGGINAEGKLTTTVDEANGVGGYVEFVNSSKEDGKAKKWSIYNMRSGGTGGYLDGLQFWTYTATQGSDGATPRMVLTDEGNLNIGFGSVSSIKAKEKLNVDGSIKSSALEGIGNRPVYADAEGKLIIGNSTTIRAAWVPDTASNSVQLAITSANGDRTTHPISITDEGMVRATSFQGVNGATIFPDYVFQKYYTGTSSIKADYNFKSLSQVEDFVKTNGHLPGYKSAATIKAQGYVDLMETQLTNVEKIEELYLHLMEKEKEVKQLKEELKAQKEAFESRLQKLEKLIQ